MIPTPGCSYRGGIWYATETLDPNRTLDSRFRAPVSGSIGSCLPWHTAVRNIVVMPAQAGIQRLESLDYRTPPCTLPLRASLRLFKSAQCGSICPAMRLRGNHGDGAAASAFTRFDHADAVSCVRMSRATLSSTAFTNVWLFSAQNFLLSTTASLSTTR